MGAPSTTRCPIGRTISPERYSVFAHGRVRAPVKLRWLGVVGTLAQLRCLSRVQITPR